MNQELPCERQASAVGFPSSPGEANVEPRLGTTAHAQNGARGRGNPDAGRLLTLGRVGTDAAGLQ